MSTTFAHEHEWALPQLTAYSVGMLPEESTLRLEQHLAECDDCRARLAPLKSLSPAEPGHLPASLIATWPRAARLLAGLERDLVGSHLRGCELCRATLAFAGHEPVLPPLAEPVPARAVLKPARNRAWGWALALSGVAAAAAAWLLVVRPMLLTRDAHREIGTIGGLAERYPEPGRFELALPPSTSDALELADTAPGGAAVVEPAPRSPNGGLVLRLPPQLRAAAAAYGGRAVRLNVTLAGHEFAHASARLGELGGMIGLRSRAPLAAGDYELEVSLAPASAGEAPLTWSWMLRVR